MPATTWQEGRNLRENSSYRMALLPTLNDWSYMLLARGREKAKMFKIDLLNHIWISDYKKFEGGWLFDLFATLIIFCGSENKPEWIPSMVQKALWLAEVRIELLEDVNKMIEPAARKEFNRKRKQKLVMKAKLVEADNKVLSAYNRVLAEKGNIPSAIQQYIVRDTGLNQSTVSRSMGRLKLSTRKKRNA